MVSRSRPQVNPCPMGPYSECSRSRSDNFLTNYDALAGVPYAIVVMVAIATRRSTGCRAVPPARGTAGGYGRAQQCDHFSVADGRFPRGVSLSDIEITGRSGKRVRVTAAKGQSVMEVVRDSECAEI